MNEIYNLQNLEKINFTKNIEMGDLAKVLIKFFLFNLREYLLPRGIRLLREKI
jgi:hypothetical protein